MRRDREIMRRRDGEIIRRIEGEQVGKKWREGQMRGEKVGKR